MLRIRLPTGNIRDFAGSEELASAVAAGEVDRDAEIYHAKSGRWVSVTGHPVFRRAAAAPAPPAPDSPAAGPVGRPQAPSPPPMESSAPRSAVETGNVVPPTELPEPLADPPPPSHGTGWPDAVDEGAAGQLADASSGGLGPTARAVMPPHEAGPPADVSHAPAGSTHEQPVTVSTQAEQPAMADGPREDAPPAFHPAKGRETAPPSAERAPTAPPVLAIRSKSGAELEARRRSRWRVPAAVILVGSALAGVLWMNRGTTADPTDAGVRPTPARPARAPAAGVIPPDSPASAAATSPDTTPSVGPSALAGNHARLANGLDSQLVSTANQLRLNGLLGTLRLASGDSIGASRTALGRFSASLRTYRAQQQALSKAYNDSADAFVLAGAWDRGALQEWQVRVRRPEPPAVVARADALVASLDSLFGLLLEYRNEYEITADEIRFQAPRASLRYDELFQAVNANRVSPSEQISAPLSVLSEAMAGNRLPRSAHD